MRPTFSAVATAPNRASHHARTRRAWSLRAQILTALALLAALVVSVQKDWTEIGRHLDGAMNDFSRFIESTRAWLLDGASLYTPTAANVAEINGHWLNLLNLNPPHFHLLMIPFTWVSAQVAYFIWAALNLAAVAACVVLTARALKVAWTPRRIAWTVAAVVGCTPTTMNIAADNLGFFLAAAVTFAWTSARAGRWMRAGVVLGVAASLKPFLGVFLLYLVVARRWRPLVAMLTSGLACVTIGLLVFGPVAYLEWSTAIAVVSWSWYGLNVSVYGVWSRAFADNFSFTPIAHWPADVIRVLSIQSAVAVLVVTMAAVRRREETTAHVDRAFALCGLAALLAAPLGWIYYLGIAAGPMLAVAREHRTPWLIAGALGVFCPESLVLLDKSHAWWSVTVGSIYAWAALMLWIGILRVPPRALSSRPS